MNISNCQHRVSILIPCFNGKQYIDRAFKSILAQSEQDLDVILVDDGSTDQSFALAQSYIPHFESKGHSLRLFQKENGGAASAIALALKQAQGRYIQLFDIDDELTPVSSRAQADWLDANTDCDVVFANGHLLFENTDKTAVIRPIVSSDNNKRYVFEELLTGELNNYPGNYMVRHEVLLEYYATHEFFITSFGQNLQMLMPATVSKPAGFINDNALIYHVHQGSHSRPDNIDKLIANLDGYKEIRVNLLKDLELVNDGNLKSIERGYLGGKMSVYSSNNLVDEYNTCFKKLEEMNCITFTDRMHYHNVNNSTLRYLYNFVGACRYKLKQLLKS